MNVENRISIEEANTAFYRALESGMLERMDDVWAHEDWVRCVHPGWDLLTGWNRVRESWEMIFESSDAAGHAFRRVGPHGWGLCLGDLH